MLTIEYNVLKEKNMQILHVILQLINKILYISLYQVNKLNRIN